MAGKVVVSTLNNDTGVLATQNGMTGIAKAWVNCTGSTINSSFNVSSVIYSSTGRAQINFTTALTSTCSPIAMAAPSTDIAIYCYTALQSSYGTNGSSAVYVTTVNQGVNLVNPANLYVAVFSS